MPVHSRKCLAQKPIKPAGGTAGAPVAIGAAAAACAVPRTCGSRQKMARKSIAGRQYLWSTDTSVSLRRSWGYRVKYRSNIGFYTI